MPSSARLLIVLAVSVHSAAGAQEALSPSDSLMLAVASRVVEERGAANSQWTQEWFTGEFILLRPAGGLMLTAAGNPPDAWGLPDVTIPLGEPTFAAHFYLAPRQGLPVRLGPVVVNDRQVMAWPLQESLYSIDDPVLANVVTIVHESFHLYQRRTQWFSRLPSDWVDPPLNVVASDDFMAAAARERALLAEALLETDLDALRALLRSYIAARASRGEMLSAEARMGESVMEQYEAAPQLISYGALFQPAARLIEVVRADLRRTPPFDDPNWRLGSFRQWHIYATGTSIGILVERLGASWKPEVQQGSTFIHLLEAALR